MKPTCRVTFLPHDKTIEVEAGQKLIRAAMAAGVHINASCGGEGVCAKCRVKVESGQVAEGLSDRLGSADVAKGYRLACRARLVEDVTVRIPVESEVDASVLNRLSTPRRTARIQEFDFETLKKEGWFFPPLEKVYLELPPPDAQDHLPDITRLVSHLTMAHKEHRLEVDLSVIRKAPTVFREKDFRVTTTLARPVRRDGKSRIINVEAGDTAATNLAIAIDIGTTTVYGQLIDLVSGEVLTQYGQFNGQISYGEDVITRIVYAEKADGLTTLHDKIIETINAIIARIVRRAGIATDSISSITLAGNTTMTQLFLKIDPRYIRRAPYVPAATLFPPVRAAELGLELAEHATALVYPAVSSYVGGDIVAGVMGSAMYLEETVTLFMDIGTNAEIVIGNKDWMACAACSAGPAFEGGGIEFGMRAAKGAIEDFSLDPLTWEPMLLTVGNARPKGICGSGLIIMVAEMFETGLIDQQGKFDRNVDTSRLRQRNNVYEYVLAWADETQVERDIVLTEIDIENLIRAKGAIFSGCMTLLDEIGMQMSDIERIILAGGFGSYIDLEKAITIGLLPEIEPDKVTFIGNGSLSGARMSALTNHIRHEVVRVTRMMTNFELSETASFMDHYVSALFLPHTDLKLFPKLAHRMAGRVSAKGQTEGS